MGNGTDADRRSRWLFGFSLLQQFVHVVLDLANRFDDVVDVLLGAHQEGIMHPDGFFVSRLFRDRQIDGVFGGDRLAVTFADGRVKIRVTGKISRPGSGS
jgi:hypothetical protein